MNPIYHRLGLSATLLVAATLTAQEKGREMPGLEQQVVEKKLQTQGAELTGRLEAAQKELKQAQHREGGNQTASGHNSWFEVTTRDLGTFYGSGEGTGTFPFKNPRDTEIEWHTLTPSCQCTRADIQVGDRQYRLMNKPTRLVRVTQAPGQPERIENVAKIVVGPGESGEVVTHLDMHNITGGKLAHLDIHTSDEAEPHTKLTFKATGAQLFSISPKDIQLNKMAWNESREFTATVMSSMKKDWQITRMDDAGKAFDVTWERGPDQGDTTTWIIKGKYGPLDSEAGGGGQLNFHTDINGGATFQLRVMAFVQGPLDVKPGGFLSLGLIRQGKSLSKEIVFQPNDGTKLEATSLEFEKATVGAEYLTATSRKDGENLVVEMTISDQAPTGLVRGELVIKLNHPLVPEKRVMFNGFIR